jgi:hypothetical protein
MMRVENRNKLADKFFFLFRKYSAKTVELLNIYRDVSVSKHDSMQNISIKHCVGSLL